MVKEGRKGEEERGAGEAKEGGNKKEGRIRGKRRRR
jgi:hypothetical protein